MITPHLYIHPCIQEATREKKKNTRLRSPVSRLVGGGDILFHALFPFFVSSFPSRSTSLLVIPPSSFFFLCKSTNIALPIVGTHCPPHADTRIIRNRNNRRPPWRRFSLDIWPRAISVVAQGSYWDGKSGLLWRNILVQARALFSPSRRLVRTYIQTCTYKPT